MLRPVNGLMMNMCAVAGEASIGIRFDQVSSFCRALIRPFGDPVYWAAAPSAENSRVREIAIWISIAAIGPMIIISRAAYGLPPSSSSLPASAPEKHPEMREVGQGGCQGRRDGTDQNIAMKDVAQFVRDDALKFPVIHQAQDAGGEGH